MGTSGNNTRAKFYRLTKAGERELEEQGSGWLRLSSAVSRAPSPPPCCLRQQCIDEQGSGERSSPARQTVTTGPEVASTSTLNGQTPSAVERVPNGPWTERPLMILPEGTHSGTVVRAYVTARASRDAAGMPSIGTILSPLTGILGFVESLVELGAGWFQYMNQPKAHGTVEVEYHCPKPTIFYDTGEPIGDGGGGDRPNDCVIAANRRK